MSAGDDHQGGRGRPRAGPLGRVELLAMMPGLRFRTFLMSRVRFPAIALALGVVLVVWIGLRLLFPDEPDPVAVVAFTSITEIQAECLRGVLPSGLDCRDMPSPGGGTEGVVCATATRFGASQVLFTSSVGVHTPGRQRVALAEMMDSMLVRWLDDCGLTAGELGVRCERVGEPVVLPRMCEER